MKAAAAREADVSDVATALTVAETESEVTKVDNLAAKGQDSMGAEKVKASAVGVAEEEASEATLSSQAGVQRSSTPSHRMA